MEAELLVVEVEVSVVFCQEPWLVEVMVHPSIVALAWVHFYLNLPSVAND